ncbi:MAG: NADH-quinone oxidoreductase subunit NuoN [Hyphomonadaceae bacterium]|nr:NADH-quinone oxidoreductase subunit NuoN [Hyphomonadaceae bacterium]MBC6412990.1 NADH-quinone oxidoreductase subunit NuoN [Hyphomonadaceae bacterium]
MNYQLILPEILLALCASFLLGIGVSKKGNRAPVIRNVAIALLVIYALVGPVLGGRSGPAANGMLMIDAYAHYLKFFLGLSGAAALLLSKSYLKTEKLDHFEFSVLLLYAVLGMGVMVSANNMLALYIGIELQSLALYVMAAFNRDSLRASEAGLKYFVLGAISSGLLLYGITLVYGFTGSVDFDGIAAAVASNGYSSGVIAGMVFILCGLAFKISAAPFHMWTPDVYEGSPAPVTAFFASAPKLAAIALMARVIIGPFDGIMDQWQSVIIVLALLSMFVGAVGALMQTNIKRLMAYSSIANMGYALVPLASGGEEGVRGMLIFMTIYIISITGIFACILQMRNRDGVVEQISDLSGLSRTNRGMAFSLTALMFSLMGIPPLLGFFGKLFAFWHAASVGLVWLVVAALIASVIGAFYYLRIVKIMWMDEGGREFIAPPASLAWTSTVSVAMVFLTIIPFIAIPARGWVEQASTSLF